MSLPLIKSVLVRTFEVPTEQPLQTDATTSWSATTLILVKLTTSSGHQGLGYSYTDASAARLAKRLLEAHVLNRSPADHLAIWCDLRQAIRNFGPGGIATMALSAIDIAIWDLKARLLELPLTKLLGCYRDWIPIYGSGGFTSYSDRQLVERIAVWLKDEIYKVKIKVGRDPSADLARANYCLINTCLYLIIPPHYE